MFLSYLQIFDDWHDETSIDKIIIGLSYDVLLPLSVYKYTYRERRSSRDLPNIFTFENYKIK